ncbi:sulfite exporter TauE/SafE family protein [Leucobacter exalbidus]|nr:sulfite exporter TauE/SafE family protein [Leucobacter exalbidus]
MTLLPTLPPFAWALLACAAMLVGFSKTAVPGINTISIAIFAAILPARASTGALLLLLIIGDIFALITYRRHANWGTLVRLIPAVVVGVAAGALFLAYANDSSVRRVIGAILLLVIGFTLWQRWRTARIASAGSGATRPSAAASAGQAGQLGESGSGSNSTPQPAPKAAGSGALMRSGYGALGGFTTMVANAGGPVMSMYFLAAKFEVKAFLGTAAWFFAVINLAKVPVSVGLGLITPGALALDALLAPGVVIGALIGRRIASRMKQTTFEWAVTVGTVLGAVYLLVG